jgi:hypothetical protein
LQKQLMRLTDCTSAGGSPPRPGAGRAPAAPRASSSAARDTCGEPAEAGATSVFRNACTWSRSTLVSAWIWRADRAPWPQYNFTASSRVFALPWCSSSGRLPSLQPVRPASVFCASISRGFHSHGLAGEGSRTGAAMSGLISREKAGARASGSAAALRSSTSGKSCLRAILRKFYRNREQI